MEIGGWHTFQYRFIMYSVIEKVFKLISFCIIFQEQKKSVIPRYY